MAHVAVIGLTDESGLRLCDALRRLAFDSYPVAATSAIERLREAAPDVALVEFSAASRSLFDELLADEHITERTPIVAVLGSESLSAYEAGPHVDDFVVWPATSEELTARLRVASARRRVSEPEHILRFGDLVIDLANYRVTIAGRNVELTFKEYELLRFLASNRDRVFSRETLLNRVWGYDYYGGSRTVDVHIRRLRAKIEDGSHTFIETIRNVGYRFREGEPR